MKKSTRFLHFKNDQIAIHRFTSGNSEYPPILLIHGSIENGRVFYSNSGKGLAPYLAKQGFDVYVADLRGRGDSRPAISRKSKFSQTETIREELPAIIEEVRRVSGSIELHLGAHSWGGVLLMSMYALFHEKLDIRSMVFFATKRRISIINLNRIVTIDLGWTLIGRLLTHFYGYLPAIKFRMGSDNDSTNFYKQNNQWVYSKSWLDPELGVDFSSTLISITLPPVYSLVGIGDSLLGHPVDVKKFSTECGISDAVTILSKENGNLHNYGHIDILTHSDAIRDHFPLIVKFLIENSGKPTGTKLSATHKS